jgi:GTPase SAR1 family protein
VYFPEFWSDIEDSVILLGNSAVGKTSCLHMYLEGTALEMPGPNIGVSYKPKMLEVNGKMMKLLIFDTGF